MRSVGASTRPRTETSTLRGGRSASPGRRGRSDDQPPRSFSGILMLRGWEDMPPMLAGASAPLGRELDERAVGPVKRFAVRARDPQQTHAGLHAALEVPALVAHHPRQQLALRTLVGAQCVRGPLVEREVL